MEPIVFNLTSKRRLRLIDEVPFGKYKGRKLAWVIKNDYSYALWLEESFDFSTAALRKLEDHQYWYEDYEFDWDIFDN